ncbi:MAG: hypothetical protein HRT35_08870 [Algicola sp.]|nr:hypothetical protein [Algicola sp.]
MKHIIFSIILLAFTSSAVAEMSWTDGTYMGSGIQVLDVMPQWDYKYVTFLGGDNKRYYYDWSTGEMTIRAQTILNMLMAAQVSKKKVSIYRTTEAKNHGWHEFYHIRLHD